MASIKKLTDPGAVLKAIAEYDRLGQKPFLAEYGYWKARSCFLLYQGKYYDSKAIVGVAFKFEFGSPLKATEFSGGQRTVVPKLEELGFRVVASPIDDKSTSLAEEVPDSVWEGARRSVTVNYYERNPRARESCIEEHGTNCAICEFDFGAFYGEALQGYIHVHHLVPLANVGREYVVDPKKDLLPVCPNCHAVLHHGGDTMTPDQVRSMIADTQKKGGGDAA